MDSQEVLRAANEKAIKSAVTDQARPHITAKGKEGKALRKRLAIAMGLRVSSSGTPSTVDSEEEFEVEETSQNVMEMFRKQIKMTAAQKKPKFNLERQQVGEEGSSVLLRRTVRKHTSTGTDYVDDDMDYQERSTDHLERSSRSRNSASTQSQLSKSHMGAKNSNTNNHMTSYTTTQHQTVAHDDTGAGLPPEEIFSSFGEQNESSSVTQVTPVDSVKHLREKIRKNARARNFPRPIAATGKDKTLQSENTLERQRKLSGSQIPIRVVGKTSEGQIEGKGENSIQKSKIPRRKSQNASDRKDSSTKSDKNIESLLTDIFSNNEAENNSAHKLKVNLQETQRNGSINEDVVTVNVNQELHSNFATLLDHQESTDGRLKKDKNKSTSVVKITDTERKSTEGTNKMSSLNLNRSHSHHMTTYDFDTIISELEKLKISLCKTYDDFHEMNELTLGLRKELKAFRNI